MIDKEIHRITGLNNISSKYDLYNKYNILFSDLIIYEPDKSLDPVLSIITKSYGMPQKIITMINKDIIKIIKDISTIKQSNNTITKTKTKTIIILKYKSNFLPEYKSTVTINKITYKRILSQIIDSSYKKYTTFDILLWCLYYRYKSLHIYNNSQGAVHPKYYRLLNKKYGTETEGFGSFFNHTLKYYYGLFPDLEQYFGCKGNFYKSQLIKPFYVINPPFTVEQINLTIDHMIHELNINKNLTILFVIPSWVYEDRVKLSNKCKSYIKLEKYNNTINIEKLNKSGYVKEYLLYCHENFMYYDYLLERNTYFAPTNIILLSNNKQKYNMESIFGRSNIKLY
jgi:hypothetical protein